MTARAIVLGMLAATLTVGAEAQDTASSVPSSPSGGPTFGYVAPGATFQLNGNGGFGVFLRGDPGRPKKLHDQFLAYTGIDENNRYWIYEGGDLDWAFAIDSTGHGYPVFFRKAGDDDRPVGDWQLYGRARRVQLGSRGLSSGIVQSEQYTAGAPFFTHITYGDRLYGVEDDGDVFYYDPEEGWTPYRPED